MALPWLILADDLTGAADCAVAFSRRGHGAAVAWGEPRVGIDGSTGERVPILAHDADSRALTAAEAERRHSDLLAQLHAPDRRLFKKIDSTLRGQPAAAIAAAMAHAKTRTGSAFGVLAPAFPGTGRTTVDGHVRVDGFPLEQTEVWRRDHTYASAELGAMLASAGIRSALFDLATVRGGGLARALARTAAMDDLIAVCDAETDDDLARIARAGLAAAPSAFFIGSAGLAHALAAVGPSGAPDPVRIAPNGRGSLIVVGSPAAVSRAGAGRLAAEGDIDRITIAPESLLNGTADLPSLAERAAARLASGGDVLVEIALSAEPDLCLAPRLARALAEALTPAASAIGALAATGGETAAALLSRLGVHGIRLADEIEPGVSLGLTLGALSVPIATKAGAFGDAGTLVRIRDRLRIARLEGSLA